MNQLKSAYRFRTTRKNFKGQWSRIFDNLNEAKEYLTLSKTVQGKKQIYSIEQIEEKNIVPTKKIGMILALRIL